MSDVTVVSRTQKITVDLASSSASVAYAGPQGPAGPSTASGVSVVDSGGHYTAGDLEAILQEIGVRLTALEP